MGWFDENPFIPNVRGNRRGELSDEDREVYVRSALRGEELPSQQRATFETSLNALYQQYFGRDATAEEVEGHYGNPGGLPAVEQMLQEAVGSEEVAGPAPGAFDEAVRRGGVTGRTDATVVDPTATPARYETGRTYQPVHGWDTAKLQDLSRQNPKYDFLRAAQTLGIQGNERQRIGEIAEFLRTRGYPNIRVVGDDKLNFGHELERGDVDVFTSDGRFWWGPPEAQGGGAGAGAGAGGAGGGAGGAAGGAGLGGLAGGAVGFGDYTAPWTREFTYDPWAPPEQFTEEFEPPAEAALPPAFEYDAYTPPEWTEQFKAPTTEEMYQDPGYQFRVSEDQKATERLAAARGTLLTGGTIADVAARRQGLASQEYRDVYGRKLGEYGQRYGEFAEGAARGRGAYDVNLARAGQEYGSRVGRSGEAYGRARTGFEDRQQRADEAYRRSRALFDVNYAKGRSEYDLARDVFYQGQDRPFRKLMDVAHLGRY